MTGRARRAAEAALVLVALGGAPAAAAPWTSGAIHGVRDLQQLVTTPAAPDRAYLLLRRPDDNAAVAGYVTEDRGVTWTPRPLPEPAARIDVIPGPPELVVETGASGRMYRSTDQGRSWLRGHCCAFAIDPGNVQHLVGFDENGAELGRSLDGGATWQQLGPVPFGSLFRTRFLFGNGTLWAVTDSGGFARSADVGATWQVATGIPEGDLVPAEGTPGLLFADRWRSADDAATWHETSLPSECFPAVAPVSGSPTVWAGACAGAYRSTDGGATFAPVVPVPPVGFGGSRVWPLGDGTRALMLGEDGPWLIGGGDPPAYRGDTLPAITAAGLVPDPHVASRAAAGAWTTADTGATWHTGSDGWEPFGHVGRRTLVFSAADSTLGTRPDAGGPATPLPVTADELITDDQAGHVWVISGRALLRSEDGVAFRRLRAAGLPHPRVDPDNEDAGLGIFGGVAGGRSARTLVLLWDLGARERLVISRDGGRTFRVSPLRISGGGSFVFRIAVDGRDGRLLLARDVSDRLWVSRDGGRRFVQSLTAVRSFAVDPTRRGVWYAGRATRLYVTRDAGRTWRKLPRPPGGRIGEVTVGAGRLWAITATRIASTPIGESRG